MKLFSTSADGIYTRIISLFSFPSRLFQTTILLKRSGKTMGKYENILDQGKSIVIFDDQREREREFYGENEIYWRERERRKDSDKARKFKMEDRRLGEQTGERK